VANPVKQVSEILRIRRYVQQQIDKLDALVADGTITKGHYDSTISDYRSRLKSVNRALEAARETVRPKLREARREESNAATKLANLQSRHEDGQISHDEFARREPKLRSKLEKATTIRAELERAMTAESPADLLPPGQSESEDDRAYNPYEKGYSAEFPGVSVPERLYMLFREFRNPEARRPITVSAIALGVLTAIVVGAVAISGALADDVPDVIGKGEVMAPVYGENLAGVGRISFTLTYDDSVLTATEIVPGVLSRARTVTTDVSTDGIVTVDIDSTYGFDPSGELVLVVFKVHEISDEKTDILVSDATADAHADGTDLTLETEDGWVDTSALDVLAPVLRVT